MPATVPGTALIVTNASSESVTVWLTLGSTAGTVQDVSKVDWDVTITQVPNNLRQGSFTLAAGQSTSAFSSNKLGFGGNVGFGSIAPNCPSATYPNGVNIAEFMLNNAYQAKTQQNPQESIDISCNMGVNASIEMSMTGGAADWTAYNPEDPQKPQTVTSFSNLALGKNSNVVGIYPANCPNCTSAQSPPMCGKNGPSETPSTYPVCQIGRAASDNGGTVTITFNGWL